jgi:hypothetical protein
MKRLGYGALSFFNKESVIFRFQDFNISGFKIYFENSFYTCKPDFSIK